MRNRPCLHTPVVSSYLYKLTMVEVGGQSDLTIGQVSMSLIKV